MGVSNLNRNCPSCGKEMSYSTKYSFSRAVLKNRKCRSCTLTGENNPFYGKKHSEESNKKNSTWHKGRKMSDQHRINTSKNNAKYWLGRGNERSGTNNPFYGKKHSEESKIKNSNIHIGKKLGPPTEEHKRKIRVSKLKRLIELGIPTSEDRGAGDFFKWVNEIGFNFKPRYFWKENECGYASDGYDEQRHIWCEFDTPYHNVLSQQKKDLVRQENIIKYFELVGHPLTGFIRIKSDKNGKVLDTKCIYKSKKPV